jgi:hypothetical protein
MIQELEKEIQRLAQFGLKCSRPIMMSVGVCTVVTLGTVAQAQAGATFSVTNLITDNQSVNPAQITDPNLVNPWGVSFGPTTPIWVSNGGTGNTNLYTIAPGDQDTRHGSLVIPLVSVSVCALCNVQFKYTGERLQPACLRRFLRGSDFISREPIVGGKSSALRRPPDGGMQLPHASASPEGARR